MSKRKPRVTKKQRKAERRRRVAHRPSRGQHASPEDDGPCGHADIEHLGEHVREAGVALIDAHTAAGALQDQWPDTPEVADLRALLAEVETITSRCHDTLLATYERCKEFLSTAPHVHLVDGAVIAVDAIDGLKGLATEPLANVAPSTPAALKQTP